MANVIKHKRGSGSDPSASNLVVGELAIRTDNGKLFTKMDSGAIAEIAGGGSDIAINTLSSSSATGGGSATFNGSAYRFTLSSPPSVSAAQLLVSVNGVIQKPVAGTGQPSEGFSVDGNDIIFGDAPATGADFFILTFRSLGVSEPADNSVTSAKIVDGAIVNADINASAAIAGSKISPIFTSSVGINNSSPSAKLHVVESTSTAAVKIKSGTSTNQNASLTFLNDNEGGLLHLGVFGSSATTFGANEATDAFITANNQLSINAQNNSGQIRFGIGSTPNTKMLIDSSGNVRIGSGTPATFGSGTTVLETYNANSFTANLVTSGTHQLQMIASQTHGATSIGTRSNHNLNLCANDSTKVTITTAGNVGIGNTPSQKLDVSGNINTTGELRFDSATRRVFYRPGNNDMIFEGAANFFYMQDIGNTAHKWFTNSGDVRLLIQADGKVGIGQTNPSSVLHITGSDDADNFICEHFGTALVVHHDSTDGEVSLRAKDTSGNNYSKYMTFFTQPSGAAAAERVRIHTDGSITTNGLTAFNNITSPGLTVSVNGRNGVSIVKDDTNWGTALFIRRETSIGTGNYIEFAYGGTVLGTVNTANGSTMVYGGTSDYRLKENITNIDSSWDKVKELKPVNFNFKHNPKVTVSGFIAHEVQAVCPEAATGTKDGTKTENVFDKDGVKTGTQTVPDYQQVDPSKLIPILTAGLKEAIVKIETLETKVAALEAG